MSETAKTRYNQHRDDVLDLLKKLTDNVKKARDLKDPDWADVGDMARLKADLRDIASYQLDWD